MTYTQEARQKAIDEYISNPNVSYRQLRQKYGVPVSTIRDGVNGAKSQEGCHENQQCLTNDQEKTLANWIIDLDNQGMAPGYKHVLKTAQDIAVSTHRNPPQNVEWVKRFLKRSNLVHSGKARKLVATRSKAADEEIIREWFDLFEATCKEFKIKKENVYNFDETGIQIGKSANEYVIFAIDKKRTFVTEDSDKEMATAIEAISADGVNIPPAIIFKGVYLMSNWFPLEEQPEWFFITSKSGWTSNYIALAWLKEVFIPNTQPNDPEEYRLLICDGHCSHTDIFFMNTCIDNKIHVLYLPAHTSHITQPLDLVCFGKLKREYKKLVSDKQHDLGIHKVQKKEFIKLYEKARDGGMSKRSVRSSWKAAGLFPFCPDKVLESSLIVHKSKRKNDENLVDNNVMSSEDANISPKRKLMRVYQLSPSKFEGPRYRNKKKIDYDAAYNVINGLTTKVEMRDKVISQFRLKADEDTNKKGRKRVKPKPNTTFFTTRQDRTQAHQSSSKEPVSSDKTSLNDFPSPFLDPN